MSAEMVQLFLFRQTGNGYMPIFGGVEIQGGKVTSCQIPEAHRALWCEVSEALRIELALRTALQGEGGAEVA